MASYLGVDRTPAIDTIVRLTNGLVEEQWADPLDPVPTWVTNIAYAVAVRAGSNPQGLTSTTRSWDDVSITNRWEANGEFTGVSLTDAEAAALAGLTSNTDGSGPVKSIGMTVPGWSRYSDAPYGY